MRAEQMGVVKEEETPTYCVHSLAITTVAVFRIQGLVSA